MGSSERRRVERLLRGGGSVLIASDDALISGPVGCLTDLKKMFADCRSAGVAGILGYVAQIGYGDVSAELGFVANLTASTVEGQITRKMIVCSVERAVREGADAVACHVNIGSMFESEMLATLGAVKNEASRLGVPVMAICYPRREGPEGVDNHDLLRIEDPGKYAHLIRHSVRVGVELGADLVKTQFPGSVDSMREVVEGACGVPLLIAGGPLKPIAESERLAVDSVLGGAAGVSFGRNLFLHNAGFLDAARGLVGSVREAWAKADSVLYAEENSELEGKMMGA